MKTQIPSAPEAEIGAIGCCLVGGLNTSLEAVETLPASVFFREDCQQAYAVIESLATQGKPVDLTTLLGEWPKLHKVAFPPSLYDAINATPSAANLPYYRDELIETAKRRKLLYAAAEISRGIQDKTKSVDGIMREVEETLASEELVGTNGQDAKDACRKLVDYLEDRNRLHLAGKKSGLRTGFAKLDYFTDGLQFGEMSVLACRPSVGKTALALNMLEQICFKDKVPSLVVTIEMSTAQIMRRLFSSMREIPMNRMRAGEYNDAELSKMLAFKDTVTKGVPLFFEEAVDGIDSNRLAAVVRRNVRQHGVKFVIVDYLQKVDAVKKHEKRTYEIAEVSKVLKGITIRTNVAMLVLAQLNRESEKEKDRVPRLSDLADCGQIERDADLVALLYRKRGDSDAKLIIAKQRDGELGSVPLTFHGQFCRFETPVEPGYSPPHCEQETSED